MGKRIPFPLRFWSKVDQSGGPDACWPWTASKHYKGYGEFKLIGAVKVKAHRVAYELSHAAEVPDGLMVDHVCHNVSPDCPGGNSCPHRACCNPAHLALADAQENSLRSRTSTGGKYARRTHCAKGHEYTPNNIYWVTDTARHCKTCLRAKAKAQRAKEARRCTHPGCTRTLAYSGLCSMHVTRLKRGLDMDAPAKKNYRPGPP